MKKIIGLLVMMTISSAVYAKNKLIKCTGPVGGRIVRVEGTLQLSKISTGQMQAEGRVKINAGASVDVAGVYDLVGGGEYATLAPKKNSKITMIYINFKDSENSATSYVEADSKMYPLNCGSGR